MTHELHDRNLALHLRSHVLPLDNRLVQDLRRDVTCRLGALHSQFFLITGLYVADLFVSESGARPFSEPPESRHASLLA